MLFCAVFKNEPLNRKNPIIDIFLQDRSRRHKINLLIYGEFSKAPSLFSNVVLLFFKHKISQNRENKIIIYKYWRRFFWNFVQKVVSFSNDELHIILKRRNLEIGEHSIFFIIETIGFFKSTLEIQNLKITKLSLLLIVY